MRSQKSTGWRHAASDIGALQLRRGRWQWRTLTLHKLAQHAQAASHARPPAPHLASHCRIHLVHKLFLCHAAQPQIGGPTARIPASCATGRHARSATRPRRGARGWDGLQGVNRHSQLRTAARRELLRSPLCASARRLAGLGVVVSPVPRQTSAAPLVTGPQCCLCCFPLGHSRRLPCPPAPLRRPAPPARRRCPRTSAPQCPLLRERVRRRQRPCCAPRAARCCGPQHPLPANRTRARSTAECAAWSAPPPACSRAALCSVPCSA